MGAILSFTGPYRFLSNFYILPDSIEDDRGIPYMSVEHAFQASKSLDTSERLRITNIYRAGEAKAAGRRLKIRPDWEQVKVTVMRDLLMQKFRMSMLGDELLQTEDAVLVEGNYWHDNFWGICTCTDCADIEGLNTLGNLLMEIRAQLQTLVDAEALS